jgi:putative Holliday junction resolvase
MRYLGLDLGSRTLGVAVSDKTGLIASSLEVIRHEEEYDRLLDEVKNLVEELSVEAIVLGFPKNMNNTIGPKGELSLEFKEKLEKIVSIPVYLQDERLSTKSALDTLIKGDVSRKNRKKVVDSVAATIILQSFLDRRKEDEEK